MKKDFTRLLFFILVLMAAMLEPTDQANAQRKDVIRDEAKVPDYVLPDLLTCSDGTKVSTKEAWESKRRPEVLQLFADHVYGNFPELKLKVEFSGGGSREWSIFDETAIRKEVEMKISNGKQFVTATLLLTLPKTDKPIPCFIGYNFNGNHTTTSDERVTITSSWVRDNKKLDVKNNQANEKSRGTSARRWPYKEIVKQGFGVCTIYYGDIDPDNHDEFKNGIHPLFYSKGQTKPTEKQWGSIGAWAWGLSQGRVYLQSDPAIDSKHVAVIGHSRLGKTSLWAGATDPGFWLTISNDSGCGGAALHRRKFGETVKIINTNFPHWFCDQFVKYNDKESEIPVDQHMLIALMAPRNVYVASASEDSWADPKGEFLSLSKSNPVFELYGQDSISGDMPKPSQPLHVGSRGYHLREGRHDINLYDWKQYLKFAKERLR